MGEMIGMQVDRRTCGGDRDDLCSSGEVGGMGG